jgi:gliding motility-associated-like protein
VYSTTDLELCYGDSALFGGVYYGVSGVYRDTLQAQAGCDSVSKLVLTINELNVADTTILIACDSAEWRGTKYMTSGIYSDTLQSSAGCDSIITVDLTINGLNAADTTVLVACDSAEWRGTKYMTSGMYSDTLQSSAGCDSIMVLDLTINSSYAGDTTILVSCDSAEWRGTTYTTSGLYNDTLQSIAGCDSIITLALTINESYDILDTLYRCVGDSALLAGSYQTVSGLYVDTLQSVNSCDSILRTELVIDTVVYSTTDLELCYGDSALFAGVYYGVSGVYRDTLQAQAGCDSVSKLVLTINELNVADTTILIACDSTVWNATTYTTTGIYRDTLQSIAGCDSIITLDLTINESYEDVIDTLYRCVGDSALLSGSYQTVSGLYVDTLQSITGCDSILRTELIIDTVVYSTTDLELCFGDSTLFGGVYYQVSGVYTDTLQVQAGCDSVSKLVLTIKDINIVDTISLVVCDEFITQVGNTISNSGIYYDTLQSVFGCDSIIIYDVIVNNTVTINIIETSCGPYTSPLGNIYTSTGFYTDSLVSLLTGCDSLIIIELTIFCNDIDGDGIPDDDDDDNDNDGISDDDEGTGDSDGDGIPDYLDLDSDNDGIYDVVESGNGLQDTNNDGVIDSNDTGFSDNDNNGMADSSQGLSPIDTDSDGTADYLDLDSDGDGCSDVIEAGFVDGDGDGYLGNSPTSQDSLGLVVNSGGYLIPGDFDSNGTYDFLEEGSQVIFDIQPSELEIFSEGDNIVLTTESNSLSAIFYQWQISSDDGSNWLNIIDSNIFSGAQTNTLIMSGLTKEFDQYLFQLVASTPGYICGSEEISESALLQLETVLIPEGFSPNGDNINDTWHISGLDQYPINHVEVYSRWETKVFETDNYGVNNEWNGIPNVLNSIVFGNSNVPEGTYYYIITFGGEFEDKKPIKGFVYLRNK